MGARSAWWSRKALILLIWSPVLCYLGMGVVTAWWALETKEGDPIPMISIVALVLLWPVFMWMGSPD